MKLYEIVLLGNSFWWKGNIENISIIKDTHTYIQTLEILIVKQLIENESTRSPFKYEKELKTHTCVH